MIILHDATLRYTWCLHVGHPRHTGTFVATAPKAGCVRVVVSPDGRTTAAGELAAVEEAVARHLPVGMVLEVATISGEVAEGPKAQVC